MASEDEALKSGIALARCAKAAFMLSSLRSSSDRQITASAYLQNQEWLRRDIQELRIELVKERLENKKIKLCSSREFMIQVMLILSISLSFFCYFKIVLEYQ